MSDFIPAPIKPVVGIAALEALDIRAGTIERVEEVPRSDKLMKLTVNFGDHSRTILSGRKKERGNPREIEGRQALFVVNLEPRKSATWMASRRLSRFRNGPFRTALAPARPGAVVCLREFHFTPESLPAAEEINADSSSRIFATTTMASSASFHFFSSMASRTAGTVLTA